MKYLKQHFWFFVTVACVVIVFVTATISTET